MLGTHIPARWMRAVCSLTMAGLLGLTACAAREPEIEAEKELLWKTAGFAVNGQAQEEQELWVEEYIPVAHSEVSADNNAYGDPRELGIYDMCAYRLHSYLGDSGDMSSWDLERCNLETGESSLTCLTPEALGLEDMEGSYLWNGCVMADGTLVLQRVSFRFDEEKGGGLYFDRNEMIYTGLDGEPPKIVDVLPVYRERELLAEGGSSIGVGDCICDGAGNLYARRLSGERPYQSLCILDREGNLLLEETLGEMEQFGIPIRTEDGELLFPVNGRESSRILRFDLEEKKAVILAELKGGEIFRLYGMRGNDLYYGLPDGIVRWDVVSGVRKTVFRLRENGVDNMMDTAMTFREDGTPVLRMWGNIDEEDEDWAMMLTREPPETLDAVRIVSLAPETVGRVQAAAARVARKNPGCHFVYENRGNRDAEDYRTQIMTQIMTGDAPDILYVSLEDMKILEQNDALMDLRTLLPQELLDQVLPGALGIGTVSGTLVGIPPEIDVDSMMVKDDVWPGDTWTVDDVLGLMETGDFSGMFIQVFSAFYPQAVINIMIEYNLEDSFLVDGDTGECHFEDERFLKILECAKLYGRKDGDSEMGLGAGGALATTDGTWRSMDNMIENFDMYGDDVHYVGYPTETGNGNYVKSNGVVVVSRSADPEAASLYLECLLSEKIQNTQAEFAQMHSVRKVRLEDIQYLTPQEKEVYGEDVDALWQGYPLQVREDGTTVLHDCKQFLESCAPVAPTDWKLLNIIWEEAQAYIEGDKSVEETARIINSRVQVYMNERR